MSEWFKIKLRFDAQKPVYFYSQKWISLLLECVLLVCCIVKLNKLPNIIKFIIITSKIVWCHISKELYTQNLNHKLMKKNEAKIKCRSKSEVNTKHKKYLARAIYDTAMFNERRTEIFFSKNMFHFILFAKYSIKTFSSI